MLLSLQASISILEHFTSNNNLSNLQLLTREENGVKRHKRWVVDRMNFYKVYEHGVYKGLMNYVDLDNKYKIKRHDISKYNAGTKTRRINELGIVLEKV